ncbi:MAG: ABC transporter ATP-binding protein, partial [Bryobacteraceae bacterium]
MIRNLRARPEWKFFSILPKANGALTLAWWIVLLMRGFLPALFAIAMGVVVGAAVRSASLAAPLALVGVLFVLLQVLSPLHRVISTN